jgi:hypothetical protein
MVITLLAYICFQIKILNLQTWLAGCDIGDIALIASSL